MLKLLVTLELWRSDLRARIDERGATAVEYSIMITVVALMVFGSAQVIGQKIQQPFNRVSNSMPT